MISSPFAIVDIETTGGYAGQNRITEIAIILFNGKEVEGKYETLVNPQMPIQRYVQSMTGITDAMVAQAPLFATIAPHIYNLLKDRIFVAHNVNFDYSFIKHQLQQEGLYIDVPKICTVRLARKVFPGLHKYGLGGLSRHFGIENNARHRAMGDTEALLFLFKKMLLQPGSISEIEKLTKRRKAAQYLPPNLNISSLEMLPSLPGIYYFHNKKNKIIYIGKAVNLKKRVSSHFSNNKISKQKQDFLREIYSINWKPCSSDLTAAITESVEIKKHWPAFNKSQKHYERNYGIYVFEDSKGYKRLAIDNKKKHLKPVVMVNMLVEARNMLSLWATENGIDPWMFFLSKQPPQKLPSIKKHNKKVDGILNTVETVKTDYLVHDGANTYFFIEKGELYGMQQLTTTQLKLNKQQIKDLMEPFIQNHVATSLISNYVIEKPDAVINF